MAGASAGKPHLLVFETKGEHLRDNPDTVYKRKVLKTLEQTSTWAGCRSVTAPRRAPSG